ncbi:MAG: hypothetical protein EBS08_07285, partial [Cytophagia bacterium]|nr:hypothetical protein [Cytophagia bacterium]
PIEMGVLSMPKYMKPNLGHDDLQIVPNPSSGEAQVRLNLDTQCQHINIIVRDALGRIIYSESLGEAPAGCKALNLPSSQWGLGAYSVQVSLVKNGQPCLLHQFLHRVN